MNDPFQEQEPNFHKILERVGKNRLRPGGTPATEQLLKWSNLKPKDKLLELSAGLGNTGIMFAEAAGCHVLLTDLDEGRLIKAQTKIPSNLQDLVKTRNMNMMDIPSDVGHFDCAITEASLTHYPVHKKRNFFSNISEHTDQYLLHEICYLTEDLELQASTRSDMQKVLNIGFFPETLDTWKQLLEEAGFTVDQVQTGPIRMLTPFSLLQDEGLMAAASIFKNLAVNPYLRSRVMATRQIMANHSPAHIGYVILRATRSSQESRPQKEEKAAQ